MAIVRLVLGVVISVQVNNCRSHRTWLTSSDEVIGILEIRIMLHVVVVHLCAVARLGIHRDQFRFALLGRCAYSRNQAMVERSNKPMATLELFRDRFDKRLLGVRLNDSAASLFDGGEELFGSDSFLMRKGHAERELVLRLIDLVEEHAREANTVVPPCRLTWRARRGETAHMKLRLERALPTTALRMRMLAVALMLLVFLALIGRSLIGALEVNAEIARLRDENAALAAKAEALTAERILLDDAAFLDLIARGYSLGSSVERPFVLAADATELPADAPGSAARRLTVAEEARSPLDAWIEVLFGS